MIALPILVGVGSAVLIGAALHDIAFRTIPNWMPVAVLLLGGVTRTLEGGTLLALLACTLIFLGAFLCWRSGWLGGGDVKLLTACGLLVPPSLTPTMLLDTALAGGVLALAYLTLGHLITNPPPGRPTKLMARILRAERRRIARRGPLPYASAIAAGALLVLFKG